jgi:Flp pilus assembly protein TadG
VKHDLKSEQGQVLGLVTVALVAMLAMSALVMDVGFAWYAKRQLQASVDAAALAGAQAFPDNAQATALAQAYLTKNNPRSGGITVKAPSIDIGYLQNSRLGAPKNKITVTETGSIPTTFAKVVGFDKFDFKVTSTACQPCGTKPFDVVVVIDRTASMCDSTNSTGCIDLNGAKDGFHVLMSILDSKLDWIGLVDLPGVATSTSDVCGPIASPTGSPYDSPKVSYLVDALRNDYQLPNGSPNYPSLLYKHSTDGGPTSCIQMGGGTSYSQSLKTAINELTTHGRSNATKVVVFMTDGTANVGPVYNCNSPAYKTVAGCVSMRWDNYENTNPCQSSIDISNAAKTNQHIIFYTIGYGLQTAGKEGFCERGHWGTNANPTTSPPATNSGATGDWSSGHAQGSDCWPKPECTETPSMTPTRALQGIASDPSKAKLAVTPADLQNVFGQIAADIESGTSRLASPTS